MGGLSLWHWLVVLVIVVLVFGTKRLKNVGQDLGEAMRGFKKGLHDDDTTQARADEASKPEDAAVTPSGATGSGDDERTPPSPH